eukprot:UC1_evm1s2198
MQGPSWRPDEDVAMTTDFTSLPAPSTSTDMAPTTNTEIALSHSAPLSFVAAHSGSSISSASSATEVSAATRGIILPPVSLSPNDTAEARDARRKQIRDVIECKSAERIRAEEVAWAERRAIEDAKFLNIARQNVQAYLPPTPSEIDGGARLHEEAIKDRAHQQTVDDIRQETLRAARTAAILQEQAANPLGMLHASPSGWSSHPAAPRIILPPQTTTTSTSTLDDPPAYDDASSMARREI